MFRIVAVVREKKKIEKRSIRPRPCSVNYFSVHCVCGCVCVFWGTKLLTAMCYNTITHTLLALYIECLVSASSAAFRTTV